MVSYIRNFLVVSATALFLAGCNETVNTVDYYVKNTSERQAKMAECSNDASKAERDGNCKNAIAAELKLSAGEIRSY
ncbi:MAG: hypothetical protein BACC_04460 [Bacteroides sp.]